MGRTNHRKMYLLLLCLLLPFAINVAFADHGPKPSITIHVQNGPDGYYIGLLEPDSEPGHFLEELRDYHKETVDEELKTLLYYEKDGWYLHVPPVSDAYHRSSPGTTSYEFGYMVPSYFRVILVEADGTVHLSDPVKKSAFNAVFDYDVTTGTINENLVEGRLHYFFYVLFCYGLTLLLEGLVLRWIGLAQKRNKKHFLIINTLTQILLNAGLIYFDSNHESTLVLIIAFFVLELLVFLIESVYYAIFLRMPDGTRKTSTSVLYAIGANALSMIGGFIITLFL